MQGGEEVTCSTHLPYTPYKLGSSESMDENNKLGSDVVRRVAVRLRKEWKLEDLVKLFACLHTHDLYRKKIFVLNKSGPSLDVILTCTKSLQMF